ncbi:hypothetical protein [Amycolatopsis alba]|nr:hypothetical protein [Amycolatopsis alba]
MAHPELNLTRDTTVTLDTRQTAKVTANVDQPEVTGGSSLVEMGVCLSADQTQSVVLPFEQRFQEMFAGTQPGTSSAAFYFGASHRLEQPRLELFGEQQKRFPVPVVVVGAPLPVGSRTPALAFGGAGRSQDLAGVEVRDRLVVLELPSGTTLETLTERVATVREHGGAMVAAWLRTADVVHQGTELTRQPGSRIAAAATAAKPSSELTGAKAAEALALPTVQIAGTNAERFAALARTGGGTATMIARPEIRDAYELSFPATGRVPAQLEHSVRKSELAAVTMAFHGYSAESTPQMHAIHRAAGVRLGVSRLGYGTPGLVRAERQEYYTPGTWAFLNALVSQTPSVGGDLRGEELFAAGKSYRLAWNGAVTGPGFRGKRNYPADRPWAARTTQEIDISIPLFSDGAGHTATADLDAPGDRGSTVLYRRGGARRTLGTVVHQGLRRMDLPQRARPGAEPSAAAAGGAVHPGGGSGQHRAGRRHLHRPGHRVPAGRSRRDHRPAGRSVLRRWRQLAAREGERAGRPVQRRAPAPGDRICVPACESHRCRREHHDPKHHSRLPAPLTPVQESARFR